LLQPAREEPIGASGELVFDQQLEKLEMGQGRGLRLCYATRQGFHHARQAQMAETGR
jgi:hypothetical protein